ncbi:MAG: hypothetical protein EBU01_10065 [Crocinitomicaceae bacterium]|nr:hypothetical protein [Crocinitomicaceae bacterium]
MLNERQLHDKTFHTFISEDEILNAGFALLKQQRGFKVARYYFSIDEDYSADLIAEYEFLQQQKEVA